VSPPTLLYGHVFVWSCLPTTTSSPFIRNQQASLHANLEMLLEMPLPEKEQAREELAVIECGICYSRNLEGQLPSKTCDNPKCNQPFHAVCLIEVTTAFSVRAVLAACLTQFFFFLFQWLRTLPNTRQSFNTLFGTCPYCSEALSIVTN